MWRGERIFKGALRSFWEDILIRGARSSLTDLIIPQQTNSLSSQLTYLNKNIFLLFICGGPCHLSSFEQFTGLFFPPKPACLFRYEKKKTCISEFVFFVFVFFFYSINIVNIKIVNLNFLCAPLNIFQSPLREKLCVLLRDLKDRADRHSSGFQTLWGSEAKHLWMNDKWSTLLCATDLHKRENVLLSLLLAVSRAVTYGGEGDDVSLLSRRKKQCVFLQDEIRFYETRLTSSGLMRCVFCCCLLSSTVFDDELDTQKQSPQNKTNRCRRNVWCISESVSY